MALLPSDISGEGRRCGLTRPVRVVHLVEDLRTGGLEKVVRNLVITHKRAHFQPEVWCLNRGGEIADEIAAHGIPVSLLGMEPQPSLGFVCGLARRLRHMRPRIVHCHGYTACTVGRSAAILARIPRLFAHIHTQGTWLHPRQQRIERALSVFTTKVICVSEAVREFVVRIERISESKTEVIYNGIPAPRIPEREQARQQFGIPIGVPVLACIASLEPHKGHSVLIEAAKIAREKLDNLTLLVAGDGSLRNVLERHARDTGAPVVFLGHVQDVGPVLAAMDALALLSQGREGLGIATIEAMAASRPVIASRLGGLPELVEDGSNGFLCDPGNAAEAANRIVTVLDNAPLARAMGEAGRAKYLARFTLERMVSSVERLYEE